MSSAGFVPSAEVWVALAATRDPLALGALLPARTTSCPSAIERSIVYGDERLAGARHEFATWRTRIDALATFDDDPRPTDALVGQTLFHTYGAYAGVIAITVGLSLVGVVTSGTLAGSMLPFLLRAARLRPGERVRAVRRHARRRDRSRHLFLDRERRPR